MDRRGFVFVGASVSAVLLALIVASPYLAPYGTYVHLDGQPVIIDHDWHMSEFMYLLGDFFCHQQMDRSFVLNGSQLPFCIRDVGILTGLAAGFGLCCVLDRRLSDRRFLYAGIALFALMGVQWLSQYVVDDMPMVRFASGIIGGIGITLVLCWSMYREEK